ncbi:MAG: hypothetical protein ACREJX_12525, partial [Polyangiaceae bacterium]
MNARRWLVLAALAVGGCSGGSNSGTGSDAGIVARGDGGACDATHDCLPTKCICGDGTTPETSAECVAGSCVDESSECVDRCGTSGVVDAGPIETVAGSPECDAFCAKAVQQCGSGVTCNESFFCEVTDGQC